MPEPRAELAYASRVPAGPRERTRTFRTVVVAVVIMWIVLVAAWSLGQALNHGAFGRRLQSVQDARQRLGNVEDLSGVFATVNTAVEPAVVKLDVERPVGRAETPDRRIPV